MADQKISELTALTGANVADDDAIAIVDTSATETKKIVFSELKNALDTATGFVRITGDTMTGNLNMGDTVKATFGAGSDLEIFHWSNNASYIQEKNPTGSLIIEGADIYLRSYSEGDNMIVAQRNDAVTLYYDNAAKIATTSTGIDVTGTVTADGLTVDGSGTAQITSTSGTTLELIRSGTAGQISSIIMKDGGNVQNRINSSGGALEFEYGASNLNALKIANNGDISFYDSSGSSQAFFWDASAESLGIGTTSPSSKLHVNGIAKFDNYIHFGGSISTPATAAAIYRPADNQLAFSTANNERMRINSEGNVGLFGDGGTQAIDHYSNYTTLTLSNSTGGIIQFEDDGALIGEIFNGTNHLTVGSTASGASLRFRSGASSEAMRIDSSGRVMIAETSNSGYSNNADDLIVGDNGSATERGISLGSTLASTIRFNDGSDAGTIEYVHSDNSMRFGTTNGSERMRIDSSGNVGIGCTPSQKLHVKGTTELQATNSTNGWQLYTYTDNTFRVNYNGAGADEFVIESGGNVGIGTSNPIADLSIVDGASGSGIEIQPEVTTNTNRITNFDRGDSSYKKFRLDASEQQFYISGSEAMRIDSSGRVGIGTSSPSNKLTVSSGAMSPTARFSRTTDGTSRTVVYFYSDSVAATVGSIGITDSATSYNTSSDHRLKENVVDLTGATARLKQLAPKRFNFIVDPDDTTVDGFLAHEVQSVVPEAITGTHNEVDADGNPVYQGIDQSKLVPLLIATIKELEARITALENA